MFGKKSDNPTFVRQVTNREFADHNALEELHRARDLRALAAEALDAATKLDSEAAEALIRAKREVKRIAEDR